MHYLDLFDRGYIARTPLTGSVVPSDLSYLRRLYTFNKDSIVNYYHERHFAVKNTHILSRYLEHVYIHSTYDDYRYLSYAEDKVTYLAKHFKFTSDIEKGVVHPPYFFGNAGEELIMAEDTYFNVGDITRNWKTASPVTILSHPRNDLKLLLPLGNDDGSKSGLSSMSINFSMLSVMYRKFIQEEQRKASEETEGVLQNKNHFVIKYVLPSMMEDEIDHVFLNRVMDLHYGVPIETPRLKHRFKLFEPETQVGRYAAQTLDVITSKRMDFPNILNNIQLIFKPTAGVLLGLPEDSVTRQNRWAMLASRLKYMCFVYDVAKDKGLSRQHINDWKLLVKRIKQDKGFYDAFSYEVTQQLNDYLYRIEQM